MCLGTATSCLVRTRRVEPAPVVLNKVTIEELIAKLRRFGEIRTMKATVEFRLAVKSDDHSTVTEYTEVPGFALIRRPSMIRTQAMLPVVGTTVFEMVSDGETYRVHLPSKKRFLIGDAQAVSSNGTREEKVRPQHILEALLIDPPRDNELYASLENTVVGNRAYQVIYLLGDGGTRNLVLSRKFWFDRVDLSISRQQVFDENGDVVTDARYRAWAEQDSLPYPRVVRISRPQEGYDLQVRVIEPGLNAEVADESFELEPPKGIKVERVGGTRAAAGSGP